MASVPEEAHRPDEDSSRDLIRDGINDARSHDLVFAVVGYMGAGTSWVAEKLADELRDAGYLPRTIKVSTLIKEAGETLGFVREQDLTGSAYERTEALQKLGHDLRERFGFSFLAGLAIRQVHADRDRSVPSNKQAFILDSLKRPEEVDTLRDVYGRSLYVISVLCHPETRQKRLDLKFKGSDKLVRNRIIDRDRAATGKHGQLVLKTLHLGDFFVRNEEEGSAVDDLRRVLDIVLQRGVVRPTRDERGMYAAWGASLRSSCLSRQVGAAILDVHGEILSTGTNDVPKFGGGLYQDGDDLDNRCFRWNRPGSSGPQCHNDATKYHIYQDVFKQLKGLLTDEANEDMVRERIERTRVRDLIEFSRAVHAEMDALLGLARKGASSSVGTSLYATTYPCHSCARHIVAAGIREVIYIEPYTKSMAADLHEDTIHEPRSAASEKQGAAAPKVTFRLFSGLAPRRFASLFEKRHDLKDNRGRLLTPVATALQDPVFTQTFLDFERTIAERIAQQLDAEKQSHAR